MAINILFACSDESDADTSTDTTTESRESYISKMGWISPEDMDVIEKSMPQSTAGLDPDERKEGIIQGLRNNHLNQKEINRLILLLEKEKTVNKRWDYDYIRARMSNYRREMASDQNWQKIK